MSLFANLLKTYDNYVKIESDCLEKDFPMLPLSHIRRNLDIEVTIDIDGNFVDARILQRENAKGNETGIPLIIPITIEAAKRTSGVAPCPLNDNLKYIAPIFNTKAYEAYIKLLSEWEESEYGDIKLTAVRKYVENKTIINDLVNSGIIKNISEASKFDTKSISWVVVGTSRDIDSCCMDSILHKKWHDYYSNKLSKEDNSKVLSMFTGDYTVSTDTFPKSMFKRIDVSAKIITSNANGENDFVFRERFTNADEAMTIGYEDTQKVYSMLEWLVGSQKTSISVGNSQYVFWNPEGKNNKRPINPFKPIVNRFIPSDFFDELKDTFNGYRNAFKATDKIIVAGFDCPSKGRMSIVYYNEFFAHDFFQKLENWFTKCAWPIYCKGGNKIMTPSFYNIVCAMIGTGSKEGLKITSSQEVLLKNYEKRLLKCLLEGNNISIDIIKLLTAKASRPQCYDYDIWSRKVLFTACAVLHKYYSDKNKEEYSMNLNLENTDRSYLYGRLLAVYEKIERDTYRIGENREPNAIRYFETYTNRPLKTSASLYKQLLPYMNKLNSGARIYYQNIIDEIMDKLGNYSEAELKKGLRPTYLLGYSQQRKAFYTKSKSEETAEE